MFADCPLRQNCPEIFDIIRYVADLWLGLGFDGVHAGCFASIFLLAVAWLSARRRSKLSVEYADAVAAKFADVKGDKVEEGCSEKCSSMFLKPEEFVPGACLAPLSDVPDHNADGLFAMRRLATDAIMAIVDLAKVHAKALKTISSHQMHVAAEEIAQLGFLVNGEDGTPREVRLDERNKIMKCVTENSGESGEYIASQVAALPVEDTV